MLSSPVPAVAVGASAGGLDAIGALLEALPERPGFAFLVVQHLDPSRPSRLPQILGRRTVLPVHEMEDGQRIEADHVYVLPPGHLATMQADVLVLARQEERPRMPINVLFTSVARRSGGDAVAVLLSGTGEDGTEGLLAVRDAGGVTFVQDAASAQHPEMPGNALAAGAADAAHSPAAIAARVCALPRGDDDEGPAMQRILDLLSAAEGIDFRDFRATMLRRRIQRRATMARKPSIAAYARWVCTDAAELRALHRDMLIPVTTFFRDKEVFRFLDASVWPGVVARAGPDGVRVWVPGCSTGQEVYSLAISLLEACERLPSPPPLQLYGTDLSEEAIKKARRGEFDASIEDEVEPERLARFFTKHEGGYRIHKSVRDHCVFARHDLVRDPPFGHLDVVSCRNVLIYLAAPAQQDAFATFHQALDPGGILILGASEGPQDDARFKALDGKHNVFTKHGRPARLPGLRATPPKRVPQASEPASDIRLLADQAVAEAFAPPGLILTDALEVVQLRGNLRRYLDLPRGDLSLRLEELAPDVLAVAIREAVQRVRDSGLAARSDAIEYRVDGTPVVVDVHVLPLATPAIDHYIVLFHDHGHLATSPVAADEATEVRLLRAELAAAKRLMATTVRDQKQTNEALASANEEAGAANEELQSANEELESAKEELQATNEEISTLNDELRQHNEDLRLLKEYAEAIVVTVRHPLVVLRPDLSMDSANPAFYTVFGDLLHPGPFTQRPPWDVPALHDIVTAAAREAPSGTTISFEIDVAGTGQRIVEANAQPLNATGGATMVLVALEDVTESRREGESEARLAAIVESSQDAIITESTDGTILTWNKGAQAIFGYEAHEIVGQPASILVPPAARREVAINQKLLRRGESVSHFETRRRRKDGRLIHVAISISPLVDRKGRPVGAASIARDITRRVISRLAKQEAERLRGALAEAESYSYMVTHDLRTPLRSVIGFAERLIQECPTEGPAGEYAATIHASALRMGRTIDGLLKLSRVSRTPLERSTVDLSALAVGVVEEQPTEDQHRVEVRIEPGMLAMADRELVRILLSSLLANSWKFTRPNKAGRVECGSQREGGQTVYFVKDNGIGFQQEEAAALFEPFHRLHPPHEYGGMGVGLATARRIVERHGGRIWAEGAPGKGATVYFTLEKDPAPGVLRAR